MMMTIFRFEELVINEMRKATKKKSESNTNTSSDDDDDEDDDEIDQVEQQQKNNSNPNDFVDLNNKTILVALLKQINRLHETNTKIFRNLHDTKGM
jgi:hypothetical protein